MTINEAITVIDNLMPNAISRADKLKWLSRLDGQIKQEIIDTHYLPDGVTIADPKYTEDTAGTTALLAAAPHDEIYPKYLEAMINYTNGEIARYNNAMAMFNAAYKNYTDWYNRNYMPKGITNMRCY